MRAEEFVSEKINPEFAQANFAITDTIMVPELGELTLNVRNISATYPPQFVIEVSTPSGDRVGYYRFVVIGDAPKPRSRFLRWMQTQDQPEQYVIAGNSVTRDQYQRKGVARAVYKWVQDHGNDIRPSTAQTAAGQAMWQGFRRAGLFPEKEIA